MHLVIDSARQYMQAGGIDLYAFAFGFNRWGNLFYPAVLEQEVAMYYPAFVYDGSIFDEILIHGVCKVVFWILESGKWEILASETRNCDMRARYQSSK
jgi:hypothetical protein